MPKAQLARYGFSAGVMSPRTALRADTERFPYALQTAINWILTPQGGLQMREGFKNFPDSLAGVVNSRIFQFHKGGDESDILVNAYDGGADFRIDGALHADTVSYMEGQDDLEALKFTNRDKTGVIVHPNYPPFYIEQDFEGGITGRHMTNLEVPLVSYSDSKSPNRPTNVDERIWLVEFGTDQSDWINGTGYWIEYGPRGATGGEFGELLNEPVLTYYVTNQNNNADNIQFELKRTYYLTANTAGVEVTATDALNFTITLTGDNNTHQLRMRPDSPHDASRVINLTAPVETALETTTEPAWSYPFMIEKTWLIVDGGDDALHYFKCVVPHYSDADTEPGIGVDWLIYWEDLGTSEPDGYAWQHPNLSIWELDQYYGPWDRGFPAVAVFNQQRLIYMNAKDATTGMWGSVLGDYHNFTLGPNDDEAFYFDIDTSDSPSIKWAMAQRKLVVGTSSGDYTIGAQITLSPSDIQVNKHNNARSNESDAVAINTDIIYIEQGKEKVRSTGYVDELQSQSSQDISSIAEHLLHARVKRLTLVQTPQIMVYGLRDDGSLVYMTRNQDMGAWLEFEINGTVIDICTAYSALTDEDELWVLVTYNGTDRHIEKMPYPARVKIVREIETDPSLVDQGIVCLDGWTSGEMDLGDQNIIDGLDQYEGLLVAAMVDDAWAGEYTVLGGAILLDDGDDTHFFVGTWAVGLKYDAPGLTFEAADGNPKGTGLGTRRRWNKLYCKVLDSALPVINGILPPDRAPETLMGIAEIIRPGIQDVSIRNAGWGNGAISFVQDRPYPTMILGFYGEYTSNVT